MSDNILYSYYNQVQSERDITSTNFTKGQINFKWDAQGNMRFHPAKSYFRIRLKFNNTTGNAPNQVTRPLKPGLGIAPNMYIMDNLFQQMKVRINGKVVSEVTDYVPQIAALKRRIQQSEVRNDTLSKHMELSHGNFWERQNEVIYDGIDNSRLIQVGDSLSRPGHTDEDHIAVGAFGSPIPELYESKVTIANNINGPITLTESRFPISAIFRPGESIFVEAAGIGAHVGVINDLADGGTITLVNASGQPGGNAAELYTPAHIRRCPLTRNVVTQRARQAEYIELIWRPCMGFWQIEDYVSGRLHFELTPVVESSFKNYAIETLLKLTDAQLGEFNFEVVSMLLYAYTGYTKTPYSGTKEYHMQECMMQSQNLTTGTLTNKIFHVDERTTALTLAMQQGDAGFDTRFSRTKFKIRNDAESRLSRYYIQYKGIMLPSVIPDPESKIDGKTQIDYSTQNYYESLHYSGAYQKVNPESILTWKEKGPFYHYEWPMLGSTSTEVCVSTQFDFSWTGVDAGQASPFIGTILVDKPQICLFNHYNTKFSLSISDGVVKSVN